MSVYRKIYYDKVSGAVIHQQGYSFHGFIKTTLQQDYQSIKDLNAHSIDTIGLLELENDSYDQDFQLCGGNVKIDLVTFKPIFTYPTPEGPVTPQKPLTQQVSDLKTENAQLKLQVNQQNSDLQGFMDYFFSTLA